MRIDVSTGSFHAAGTRARHLAHECQWWAFQAGSAQILGAQELGQVSARMASVARRLEAIGNGLHQLARAYADHEAATARVLSPLAMGALLVASIPALPFDAAALVTTFIVASKLRETDTRTQLVRTESASSVTGVDELFARVPQGSEQVRIDTIRSGGNVRYVVYISGTRDFGLVRGSQPWDMTSDLAAIRGEQISGCERSVRQAMSQAGIGANDEVVLVGHSLGGLVAARIAQSGDYKVSDVVTAGAPTRSVHVPQSIRITQFEFTNDIVPPLSGVAAATSALTIRSRFVTSSSPNAFGPHDLAAYRKMARSFDSSNDPMVRERISNLNNQLRGDQVTSSWYRGVRS